MIWKETKRGYHPCQSRLNKTTIRLRPVQITSITDDYVTLEFEQETYELHVNTVYVQGAKLYKTWVDIDFTTARLAGIIDVLMSKEIY